MEGAYYLHEKGVGEEVSYSYLQLAQSLEEYVGKMFNEWISLVEKELSRHLETPLMQRSIQSKYVVGLEGMVDHRCVQREVNA